MVEPGDIYSFFGGQFTLDPIQDTTHACLMLTGYEIA